MMSGRPYQCNAVARMAGKHGAHQLDCAAGRQQRRVITARRHVGIGVDVAAAALSEIFERCDVGLPMDACQQVKINRLRRDRGHTRQQPLVRQRLHHPFKPRPILRVAGQIVFQIERIVTVGCGQVTAPG